MDTPHKADRDARNPECLHCVIMTAIEHFFQHHGARQDGRVVIDVLLAIQKLSECTVELAEFSPGRSQRRRAFRFAHDALDATLKSQRTGKFVPVDVPMEQ